MPEFPPKYSGPTKSGICICGCRWDRHHLGVVMNRDYAEQTEETYVPQECENFGFNEVGGMRLSLDGVWEDHCHQYQDKGIDKDEEKPD